MKEVEVKVKIESVESVLQLLKGQGCQFSDAKVQEDIVYIPNDAPTVPVESGVNVLRIRKQGSKTFFTLKRSISGNHLAKLEHEMEIAGADIMQKIIPLLGFKEIAHTTKTRYVCKFQDYEICVDHVNELGDFLEIEKITDEDPAAIQKDMLKALSELGIDIRQRVNVGYDVLYVQKTTPPF